MDDKIKYSRGKHPNSLSTLAQARIKSIETRRKNKELKQMEKEQQKAEKSKYTLDLELEIFKIRKKKEEEEHIRMLMEQKYKPLSKTNINLVIRNVFNMQEMVYITQEIIDVVKKIKEKRDEEKQIVKFIKKYVIISFD